MKKLLAALVISVFLIVPASAGPKRAVRAYAHQVRMQFVDVKRHPFAWGIYFAGTALANALDDATTCYGVANRELVETNHMLGRRPSCLRSTGYTAVATFAVELPAVHALSDAWTSTCYKDATNPKSTWNSAPIPAATRNPESCRWNVPAAASSEWAIHAITIKNNLDLIERH